MKNNNERALRIIARGEHSNHCHVVTGEGVTVINQNGEITVMIAETAEDVKLKHLLESAFLNDGSECWTEEHTDIDLLDPAIEIGSGVRHGDVFLRKDGVGKYTYIAQKEYDPFEKVIRRVQD